MSVAPEFSPSQSFPLHLTASTTIAASSSGGVNAISLKNPLGQAMEILAIKWQLLVSSSFAMSLGTVIGCKLDLGKFPITNGFVPVGMFGKSEGLISEQMSDVNVANLCANEYIWRLPRPLYVPKGAVLLPTFQHRGITQQSVTVRVSYSARSVPENAPPPKKVALPYAAFYGSQSFDASVAGTDASVETDLVNPFDEPLYLQRMTGRVVNVQYSSGFIDEGVSVHPESIAASWNVRIVDSFGRPIVRRFVPLRLAFSGVSRSWEMSPEPIMDPKSFYTAYLRKDTTTYSANQFLTQAFVSIVGCRDVVGGAK